MPTENCPSMPQAIRSCESPTADNTTALYIAYHRESPLITGGPLQPIQVGRALSRETFSGMIGDDTGTHISERNPEYCELTAHYWAWQNDRSASTIGLMHYRRLLALGDEAKAAPHPEQFVTQFSAALYAEAAKTYLAHGTDFDIILPRPLLLRHSLREQYQRCHGGQDLDALCEIIAEHNPAFHPAFMQTLAENQLCLGNVFIMRRRYFDEYSALLFPLLDKLYQHRSRQMRDGYQSRFIGFLAERILTAYRRFAQSGDGTKRPQILYRNLINISQTIHRDLSLTQIAKMALKGQLRWRDTAQLISKS